MNVKEFLKSRVAYDSTLKKVLVFFYHVSKYRLWKPRKLRRLEISAVLKHYSEMKKNIRFLQIGSNDGLESDPLREFIIRDRWSGVLVEPLPQTFQKLLKNYDSYANKADLAFENIAISDRNHVMLFYYIDAKKANIPEGSANKFSSFDKEIPLKLQWVYPSVVDNIAEIQIPTSTLSDLLEKHHLKKELNLLHIDTEGHDYVILKQLDLKVTRPDIILFENLHLKLDDYKECVQNLRQNNYVLFEQHLDTIAIQKEFKVKIIDQAKT
jgi:FkbM family methyltransferase